MVRIVHRSIYHVHVLMDLKNIYLISRVFYILKVYCYKLYGRYYLLSTITKREVCWGKTWTKKIFRKFVTVHTHHFLPKKILKYCSTFGFNRNGIQYQSLRHKQFVCVNKLELKYEVFDRILLGNFMLSLHLFLFYKKTNTYNTELHKLWYKTYIHHTYFKNVFI